MANLKEEKNKIVSELREDRRHFHMFPETGFQETKTAAYIVEKLRSLGLEPVLHETAVTAVIEGVEAGSTVALRADMDALPLGDKKNVAYSSQVPGVCHACGHDGHMAMLLGAAKILVKEKVNFNGRVKLIFQPAEEKPPGGAKQIIDKGLVRDVDAIFALHLNPFIDFGKVGLKRGNMMAAADSFEITVKGKGGHAAIPHESIDSIVAASHLVVTLQSFTSRMVSPLEPMVLTVGMIEGGKAFNIIAQETKIKGTIRTVNPTLRQWIPGKLEDLSRNTLSAFGADCDFKYIMSYPPLVNNDNEVSFVKNVATELFGSEAIHELETPMMGSEDFAYFLEDIPGCFIFLGVKEGPQTMPLHHPQFDFNEDILYEGAKLLAEIAMGRLRKISEG